MKSSSTSSATPSRTPTGQRSAAPSPRKGFTLAGPSVSLDPLTHAVRRDLADVRLAEFVFAPHYAAPVAYRVETPATLRQGRDTASSALGALEPDTVFEVLDLVAGLAWGMAPSLGRAGWVDRAALGGPA